MIRRLAKGVVGGEKLNDSPGGAALVDERDDGEVRSWRGQ